MKRSDEAWAARKVERGEGRACNPETEFRLGFDEGHAAIEALAPILALHKPKAHYYPAGIDDRSWETEEEAREYADTEDEVMESFEICAECGRIEADQLREYCDEWAFRESIWPCATFKATQ